MDKRLERILPRVQKPARYVGGEYNAVAKDLSQVDTRIAFCFPDTYEIGMSNLGMRILYGVMNEMPGVWCERVFAPWGDMEEEMRAAQMPLFALESGDAITHFDIVAFSVGYEMAFPAILNMLDLAGIPLHSAERTELTPLVIAGGTAMYNAEPIADFIDLVSLGEGEDITVELVELHRRARREGWTKEAFLRAAAQLPGIYVPSLYDVTYHDDGTVAAITPRDGAPAVKIKWLAWLDIAVFVIGIVQSLLAGSWLGAILPVVALLNFLVFIWPAIDAFIRQQKYRHNPQTVNFKKAVRQQQQQRGYHHKCAVCGRTDTDYPNLQFRYCSKCAGYRCFCQDHIFSHVHFTEEDQ